MGEVSRGIPNRWFPIKPNRVRRSSRDHPWVFAYYFQSPKERDDEKWYHAIMFRDQNRTKFGAFEVVAQDLPVQSFDRRYNKRRIATRIVIDNEFRESLLRDTPELRDLWRRR